MLTKGFSETRSGRIESHVVCYPQRWRDRSFAHSPYDVYTDVEDCHSVIIKMLRFARVDRPGCCGR